MTGPMHYTWAQFCVDKVEKTEKDAQPGLVLAVCGLTHAVLALVAATVDNEAEVGMGPEQLAKWARVGAT